MSTKYCYDNTNILINKLNIRDSEKLHEAERDITALRQAELYTKPIKGNFDLKHLQDIHKHIFGDIYPFAGKLRDVDIAKDSLFCLSNHLDVYAESIFSKLKKENYLQRIKPNEMGKRLAYYFGEINALHPFREGNGRTQREFIRRLAKFNGYDLDLSNISKDEMIDACKESLNVHNQKLEALIEKSLSPINLTPRKLPEIAYKMELENNDYNMSL